MDGCIKTRTRRNGRSFQRYLASVCLATIMAMATAHLLPSSAMNESRLDQKRREVEKCIYLLFHSSCSIRFNSTQSKTNWLVGWLVASVLHLRLLRLHACNVDTTRPVLLLHTSDSLPLSPSPSLSSAFFLGACVFPLFVLALACSLRWSPALVSNADYSPRPINTPLPLPLRPASHIHAHAHAHHRKRKRKRKTPGGY
jgi:hypothetical protein